MPWGQVDDDRQRILFCMETHDLAVTNTFFKKQPSHQQRPCDSVWLLDILAVRPIWGDGHQSNSLWIRGSPAPPNHHGHEHCQAKVAQAKTIQMVEGEAAHGGSDSCTHFTCSKHRPTPREDVDWSSGRVNPWNWADTLGSTKSGRKYIDKQVEGGSTRSNKSEEAGL